MSLMAVRTTFPTANALQAQAPHQAFNRAASNGDALAIELLPDLVGPVDAHVGMPNALNVRHQGVIALGTRAAQLGIALLGGMAPIA